MAMRERTMTVTYAKLTSALPLGQRISFPWGKAVLEGVIIEDRGPLGANGHHIYRVRISAEAFPEDLREVELPETELTVLAAL